MRKLKVGIVGLGEVAQIIHLPILQSMGDKFEIAALCDISPTLVKRLGERYGVGSLYDDADSLAKQDDLDAVFVLNSDEYHADCAIAALRNRRHVLIEKPMCLTERDADAIIRARDEAGVQAMVGYMRRFAPAFTEAVAAVREMHDIQYARVRDIIGPNRFFIDQSSAVLRPSDIPAAALRDRQERGRRMVAEAIGAGAEERYATYRQLCGLSSHDLSAMREILGFPDRVLAASAWNGGRYIAAIFEYGTFQTVFETGVDEQGRFDAHIEVYGKSRSIRVQYDTPYIRHLPTTMQVNETVGASYREYTVRPTFKDPYTHELEYFYEVVAGGLTPKTTPEDAKEDLRLFRMIVEQIDRQRGDA